MVSYLIRRKIEPIKHKSYEEIIKLFEAMTQAKILMPKDINTQYNILSQIFTISHHWMEKDTKENHEKMEKETREEMVKRNQGKKNTFFNLKANLWERELRSFCLTKMKEDEFGVGL